MSVLLDFTVLLIGPILSISVLVLVAVVWRKVLASERETRRRFIVLEERMLRLDLPTFEPPPPKAIPRDTSRSLPQQLPPLQALTGNLKPPESLISVPSLALSIDTQIPPESDFNRRFPWVWELAEAGISSEAIARATGHPVGQVELILGLKRQSETTNGGLRPSGSH